MSDQEIERLRRLAAWLDAFDKATEALPIQHEQKSMGYSTYNWHSKVVRDAKAAMDGEPLIEGCIYATYANYPAARRRRDATQQL